MINEEKLKTVIYKFNRDKEYLEEFDPISANYTYENIEESIKLLYCIWNTIGGSLSIQRTETILETINPKQLTNNLNYYQKTKLGYTKETIEVIKTSGGNPNG